MQGNGCKATMQGNGCKRRMWCNGGAGRHTPGPRGPLIRVSGDSGVAEFVVDFLNANLGITTQQSQAGD